MSGKTGSRVVFRLTEDQVFALLFTSGLEQVEDDSLIPAKSVFLALERKGLLEPNKESSAEDRLIDRWSATTAGSRIADAMSYLVHGGTVLL